MCFFGSRQVDAVASWGNETSVARLSGQVVRLRFRLRGCRLHSFRFAKTDDPLGHEEEEAAFAFSVGSLANATAGAR